MTYSIIIILLFTTLLFWKGFDKTAIIFFFYNLVDPGVSVVKILSDKDIILIVLLTYVFLTRKYKKIGKYPFLLCTVLSVSTAIVSTYFSSDPHIPVTILESLEHYTLPFLFFIAMRNVKTRQFFINALVLFSLLMGFYVVLELASQSHPIPNYFISLGSSTNNLEELIGVGDRYGIMRCIGTFQNGSGLAAFGLYTAGFLLLFISGKKYLYKNQQLLYAAVGSCCFCIFVSGFRSGITLILIVIAFRYMSMLKNPSNILFMVVIAVVFCIFADALFHDYFNEIFQSIVNSNQTNIGSSQDMRQTQYDIGIYYFLQAPILGHGTAYIWNYVTQYNPEMFGAESIWLSLMVDYGIVGCITYLLWYVVSYLHMKKFSMLFFLLVIMALNTMTSTVGINMDTWVSFVIIATYTLKQYNNNLVC